MSPSSVEELEAKPEVLPGEEPDTQAWAPVVGTTEQQSNEKTLPKDVARRVISGSSALGASVAIERGSGFVANILAARLGGTGTFGAYSLAMSTAVNISTYAAGGIGATAARFSGKYPKSSSGYSTLARALTIVSLISAAVALVGLWFGAAPIAHLLQKERFTQLLRWAGVSAAGVVLLECARGFFVGQRHITALLVLSMIVGLGMIVLLPMAAHRQSPMQMILFQGMVSVAAVLLCVLLRKQLGLREPTPVANPGPLAPMLREVWSFGFVQLSGLISCNLAGWWLTTLVARADTTLVQMSFLTIASQLRNLVGLAPSLLTEGSYAVMADPEHEATRTPQRVMALCSYASLGLSSILGGAAIVVVPWLLHLLYGSKYIGASLTVAVALATAIAHMGMAPTAARLTIVSIRATAVINTAWAIFVAAAATVMFFRGGNAWQAMSIYLAAHVLSSVLVLLVLRKQDDLPPGMLLLFGFCMCTVLALVGLSLARSTRPDLQLSLTAAIAALFAVLVAGVLWLGRHYSWLPPRDAFEKLFAQARIFIGGRLRRV